MKWLSLLFLSISSFASEPLRVAVIDTGLDITDSRFSAHLCKEGHEDFTGTSLKDDDGHGTHIVGSIIKYAGDSSYCLIILKYYKDAKTPNFRNYRNALSKAVELKANIINYSGGGKESDEFEELTIKNNQYIKFVVAAGNDHVNLDKECPFYPACYGKKYPNLIVVGALDKAGNISDISNYGSIVDRWELGQNVLSTCLHNNCYATGTSMATSIFTGKLIHGK